MNDQTQILVNILARSDAIFLPLRDWKSALPAVLHERRKMFRAGGVPWSSAHFAGSKDDESRKSAQRILADLRLGKLVSIGIPRARTLTCRLTSAGDDEARALCNRPSASDAIPLIAKIRKLPCVRDSSGVAWIPEPELADPPTAAWGAPGHQHALSVLEMRMAPLLTRGVVVSTSDVHGRVWYGLTPAGMAADLTSSPASSTSPDPEAAELYDRRLREELDSLANATPIDTREMGGVPFPCNPWPSSASNR